MAVICQVAKNSGGSRGLAEIVLSDGSVWVATPLPHGLYEFVTVDERGNKITARWVKRSRRNAVDSAGTNEFKFTFSIIDPNSRRHPVMASITNNTLDIPDFYTSVSSSASKHPPTSPIRGFHADPQFQPLDEPTPERTTHAIDENMKMLIQVTGIWVALRQGLSPYFKYNDTMALAVDSSPVQRTVSVGGRMKSLTITTDAGRVSPAGTISSTPDSIQSQSIFGGRIRQKGAKGSPASTASPQLDQVGYPKRSVSSGSAFMQRAVARRAGILPSTVASDSEGEAMFLSPKRIVTEDLTGNPANQISTSHHRSLPGSLAPPVDTPTKHPQRRTQSAFLPSTVLHNGVTNGNVARHSVEIMDGSQTTDSAEKVKTSRWKAFKDFFRRSRSTTRSVRN
jgi:hypothetical protein